MRLFRFLSLALAATLPSLAALAVEPPHLVTIASDGRQAIWVETTSVAGAAVRQLVRETSATVVPGPAGWDPRQRAAFVTWSEGGPERWFSVSRDGGASWSEGQSMRSELMLLSGPVAPGQDLPGVPRALALPAAGRLFLVQFRTIGLPEWRSALEEEGAEVLGFFPYAGHVVRIEPDLVARLAALDFVERVLPYHPAFRLEPELRSWALTAGREPVRFNVLAVEGGLAPKQRLARAARALGAQPGELWPQGQLFELVATPAQLRRLAAHDDLLWVDRWTPPADDMDLVRQDSGADWLEANYGLCGTGVRGEVLDSGIQANHQDFDGVLFHGSNNVSSHGTSTFGIVFGNGARDGDGNAQATGHLPSSTGCPSQGIFADYDFLGDRFAHTLALKRDPYFASFQSNSWGGALTTAYNSVSQQMDDIIFQLDMAILQSQSNTGNQQSRPQAWAKNIISVGGVYHYNTLSTADDAWAGGASIGPAADGRIKPDVAYWYDNIYTTTSGSSSSYTAAFGGTSAATPETAGVLGLILQLWSENGWNTNPVGGTVYERQPNFSTLKALLINNAQQYPFSGTGHDLTRVHQGWGRPSVEVARERAARSLVVDQATRLTLGQAATYLVDVLPGESELKVTMVYPDPPGTTSASLHRINDVSLKVTAPDGTTVYHGNNGLLAGNYSTPGGSPNTIDTVENVFVQNPTAGTWTVEVRAAEVNQDGYLTSRVIVDVVYSLVVTGAALHVDTPTDVDRK